MVKVLKVTFKRVKVGSNKCVSYAWTDACRMAMSDYSLISFKSHSEPHLELLDLSLSLSGKCSVLRRISREHSAMTYAFP
jgi:hypothetical protein